MKTKKIKIKKTKLTSTGGILIVMAILWVIFPFIMHPAGAPFSEIKSFAFGWYFSAFYISIVVFWFLDWYISDDWKLTKTYWIYAEEEK